MILDQNSGGRPRSSASLNWVSPRGHCAVVGERPTDRSKPASATNFLFQSFISKVAPLGSLVEGIIQAVLVAGNLASAGAVASESAFALSVCDKETARDGDEPQLRGTACGGLKSHKSKLREQVSLLLSVRKVFL